MSKLSEAQRQELSAVLRTTDEIGSTFIQRSHWRGLYAKLVRRGLVTWDQDPDLSDSLRKVAITPAGRKALEET